MNQSICFSGDVAETTQPLRIYNTFSHSVVTKCHHWILLAIKKQLWKHFSAPEYDNQLSSLDCSSSGLEKLCPLTDIHENKKTPAF